MRSYEQVVRDIQNKKEKLKIKDEQGNLVAKLNDYEAAPILKSIEEDAYELMELLIFSLIKERDNFFGNVAIQLHRKIDFKLTADAALSFRGTYFEISINPILLVNNSLEEMKAIIIHEMYHMICKHLPRTLPLFKVYPQPLLNIAADCAINQFIDNLPKNSIKLETLTDMWKLSVPLQPKREVEYYIKGLIDEYKVNQNFKIKIQQQQESDSQKNQLPQGSSSDQNSDNNQNNNSENANNNSEEENGMNQPNNGGNGQSKQGGGSYVLDYEMSSGHSSWEESDNSSNMENSDDVVRSIMNDAASKSRGRIPSEIQEVIKKLNEKPIISWQEILRRYIGTLSCPYKKTVTRRDRRQPNRLDLRGKLNDHVAELIVAIDTSGSMSNDIIEYCMNEIFHIVDNSRTKITIIECDSHIGRVYEAETPSQIKPDVTGRGGTLFRPVFEWIRDNNKRNVVLIYFTDGYGESKLPFRPINKQTLWVLTGRSSELSLEEPYGEVKELRLDEKWNKR